MGKRYLITGGSGFLGSALALRLCNRGESVRLFDNGFKGYFDRLNNYRNLFDFVDGDIRILDNVVKACSNIDVIIHMAYINGTSLFYSKPDLVLDVAVGGIWNLLQAVKIHKTPEFFLASSSEVYQKPETIPTKETEPLKIPDPYNPRYSYGAGKIISEMMVLHSDCFTRSVIFRPHNVYGPNMGTDHVIPDLILKLHNLVLKEKEKKETTPEFVDLPITLPIQGTGDETRSFIYIDDFIDALLLLIDKGKHKQIYHVGTENEVSIKELVQHLSFWFDKKVEVKPGLQPVGETNRRCPNIDKIKELGFQPKFSLLEGLEPTVAWYCSHFYKFLNNDYFVGCKKVNKITDNTINVPDVQTTGGK